MIRQLHLWIGAWGAIAAIVFGFTGFVLNHRGTMKLPQGTSTELSNVEIEVPESARATPERLRDWLRDTQHLPVDSVRDRRGAAGRFNGRNVRQPDQWVFAGGNARVSWNAEFTPGNATVRVRNTTQSPLAILSRLHKGVGAGLVWLVLSDSFALAMIGLGISGILLWARGRTPRQMVFSVFGAATVVALVIGALAVV